MGGIWRDNKGGEREASGRKNWGDDCGGRRKLVGGIFSDSTPIFIGVSAPERQRVIGVMRGTEERI